MVLNFVRKFRSRGIVDPKIRLIAAFRLARRLEITGGVCEEHLGGVRGTPGGCANTLNLYFSRALLLRPNFFFCADLMCCYPAFHLSYPTLLCPNFFSCAYDVLSCCFSLTRTLLCLFFFRAHLLPCCALNFFHTHLPCCALIFFALTYPAVV